MKAIVDSTAKTSTPTMMDFTDISSNDMNGLSREGFSRIFCCTPTRYLQPLITLSTSCLPSARFPSAMRFFAWSVRRIVT